MGCGVDRGEVGFLPRFMGVDGGYGKISGTAAKPHPHWVRGNAPRPFAGLSPLLVFLALRAAQ